MKSFTTKKGTVVTIDGDKVRAGKETVHISHFRTFVDSPEKSFWECAFKRGNRSTDEIGLVATRSICIPLDGNAELIAAITADAEAFRAESAAKKIADEQAAAAERERIIAACPADCEIATSKGWLDGIVTLVAADGATTSAWDNSYTSPGQGLYYIPAERFADSRKSRAETAARNAQAKEARETKEGEAFATARATGKPAVLKKWPTDRCMNGNDSECSFDNATEWANPDGSRNTTYSCCF